jgi:hypothetical protein
MFTLDGHVFVNAPTMTNLFVRTCDTRHGRYTDLRRQRALPATSKALTKLFGVERNQGPGWRQQRGILRKQNPPLWQWVATDAAISSAVSPSRRPCEVIPNSVLLQVLQQGRLRDGWELSKCGG